MKYFAWLVAYSIPMALAGLLCGTVIVGLGFGVSAFISSEASFSDLAIGWAFGLYMAMFAVILGFLPALLYGATAYALLVWLKRASYITSGILGSIPGIILLVFNQNYGMMFLAFGVPVACCTHFFAMRSTVLQNLGANNSFKRTAAPKFE